MTGAMESVVHWALVSGTIVVELAATRVDSVVFAFAALLILGGAIGVVVASNPVHAALMLIVTLFGVAVTFVAQQANFLAAVQIIVYGGAIVVLFLFVIMFLGVDRRENLVEEPLKGQRPLAIVLVAAGLASLLLLGAEAHWSVGAHSVAGAARGQRGGDVAALGRSVFTTYLFPFEITAALLVIAVVGAVVLARRPPPEPPQRPLAEVASTEAPGPAPGAPGPVGDPMAAVAEAVAKAVAAGLIRPTDDDAGAPLTAPDEEPTPEPVGGAQTPEPVGEGTTP
jgi:NADH-quinone oxidoreductase subunit J